MLTLYHSNLSSRRCSIQTRIVSGLPVKCFRSDTTSSNSSVLVSRSISNGRLKPPQQRHVVKASRSRTATTAAKMTGKTILRFLYGIVMGPTACDFYIAFSRILDIYGSILSLRVMLKWFRHIKWHEEPFATLKTFTDPYLHLFSAYIPSFGFMDMSSFVAFFALSAIRAGLLQLARMARG
mmetsp:Transcript_11957/g.21443  ORF Transcript_11957/g.21443 Transcript_11957/m.21443 type:complete len:181 (+) Transcript_11957:22-564(+)